MELSCWIAVSKGLRRQAPAFVDLTQQPCEMHYILNASHLHHHATTPPRIKAKIVDKVHYMFQIVKQWHLIKVNIHMALVNVIWVLFFAGDESTGDPLSLNVTLIDFLYYEHPLVHQTTCCVSRGTQGWHNNPVNELPTSYTIAYRLSNPNFYSIRCMKMIASAHVQGTRNDDKVITKVYVVNKHY